MIVDMQRHFVNGILDRASAGMIQPMGEVDPSRMAPRHVANEAERKLLCAVIALAKQDASSQRIYGRGKNREANQARATARAFFHSEHFAEMCAHLDLDGESLRLGIFG